MPGRTGPTRLLMRWHTAKYAPTATKPLHSVVALPTATAGTSRGGGCRWSCSGVAVLTLAVNGKLPEVYRRVAAALGLTILAIAAARPWN